MTKKRPGQQLIPYSAFNSGWVEEIEGYCRKASEVTDVLVQLSIKAERDSAAFWRLTRDLVTACGLPDSGLFYSVLLGSAVKIHCFFLDLQNLVIHLMHAKGFKNDESNVKKRVKGLWDSKAIDVTHMTQAIKRLQDALIRVKKGEGCGIHSISALPESCRKSSLLLFIEKINDEIDMSRLYGEFDRTSKSDKAIHTEFVKPNVAMTLPEELKHKLSTFHQIYSHMMMPRVGQKRHCEDKKKDDGDCDKANKRQESALGADKESMSGGPTSRDIDDEWDGDPSELDHFRCNKRPRTDSVRSTSSTGMSSNVVGHRGIEGNSGESGAPRFEKMSDTSSQSESEGDGGNGGDSSDGDLDLVNRKKATPTVRRRPSNAVAGRVSTGSNRHIASRKRHNKKEEECEDDGITYSTLSELPQEPNSEHFGTLTKAYIDAVPNVAFCFATQQKLQDRIRNYITTYIKGLLALRNLSSNSSGDERNETVKMPACLSITGFALDLYIWIRYSLALSKWTNLVESLQLSKCQDHSQEVMKNDKLQEAFKIYRPPSIECSNVFISFIRNDETDLDGDGARSGASGGGGSELLVHFTTHTCDTLSTLKKQTKSLLEATEELQSYIFVMSPPNKAKKLIGKGLTKRAGQEVVKALLPALSELHTHLLVGVENLETLVKDHSHSEDSLAQFVDKDFVIHFNGVFGGLVDYTDFLRLISFSKNFPIEVERGSIDSGSLSALVKAEVHYAYNAEAITTAITKPSVDKRSLCVEYAKVLWKLVGRGAMLTQPNPTEAPPDNSNPPPPSSMPPTPAANESAVSPLSSPNFFKLSDFAASIRSTYTKYAFRVEPLVDPNIPEGVSLQLYPVLSVQVTYEMMVIIFTYIEAAACSSDSADADIMSEEATVISQIVNVGLFQSEDFLTKIPIFSVDIELPTATSKDRLSEESVEWISRYSDVIKGDGLCLYRSEEQAYLRDQEYKTNEDSFSEEGLRSLTSGKFKDRKGFKAMVAELDEWRSTNEEKLRRNEIPTREKRPVDNVIVSIKRIQEFCTNNPAATRLGLKHYPCTIDWGVRKFSSSSSDMQRGNAFVCIAPKKAVIDPYTVLYDYEHSTGPLRLVFSASSAPLLGTPHATVEKSKLTLAQLLHAFSHDIHYVLYYNHWSPLQLPSQSSVRLVSQAQRAMFALLQNISAKYGDGKLFSGLWDAVKAASTEDLSGRRERLNSMLQNVLKSLPILTPTSKEVIIIDEEEGAVKARNPDINISDSVLVQLASKVEHSLDEFANAQGLEVGNANLDMCKKSIFAAIDECRSRLANANKN